MVTVEPDLGLGLGTQSGHRLTGLVGHIQVQVSIVMILLRHYVRNGGVVTWQYSNLPIPWNLCFRLQHVRCASSLIQNYDFESFVAANEPMPSYGPDSPERKQLYEALNKYKDKTTDIPIVIGDEEFRTKDVRYQVMVKAIISLLLKSTFLQEDFQKSNWVLKFWHL